MPKPSRTGNTVFRNAFAGVIVVGLAACATQPTTDFNRRELSEEAVFQRQLALEERMESRRRIEEVSFRLMTAAADFCGEKRGGTYGFTVANRYSFGENMADAATAAFGLDDSARVLSVVHGSPAARAGIVQGDVITRINGKPIKPGGKSANVAAASIMAAGLRGLNLHVGGENPRRVRLEPAPACNYPVEVVNSEKVNAYADGERISVTRGMLWFTESDTDLAMVLSHELAHNIMGHAGTFASMFYDKKAREADADYVGLYVMARAGFRIEEASGFWRRMAAAFPRMIDSSSSHPLMPARFVAIRKTTEEIRRKEAKGLPLVPQRVDNLALAPTAPAKPES